MNHNMMPHKDISRGFAYDIFFYRAQIICNFCLSQVGNTVNGERLELYIVYKSGEGQET